MSNNNSDHYTINHNHIYNLNNMVSQVLNYTATDKMN